MLRLAMTGEAVFKMKDLDDALLRDYLKDHAHFVINHSDNVFTALGKVQGVW